MYHVENIFSRQVGERVAKVRTAMKMTQADLARGMSERLGKEVRPLTVTRLEGGKRPIVVDELKAAAATLRVSVADLMAVDDDLDFEYLAVVLAAEDKSRAKYELGRAVREFLSAEALLNELFGLNLDLTALPMSTRMFVAQMAKSTHFDQVVDEARRDWFDAKKGKDHDAEA